MVDRREFFGVLAAGIIGVIVPEQEKPKCTVEGTGRIPKSVKVYFLTPNEIARKIIRSSMDGDVINRARYCAGYHEPRIS